MRCNVNQPVFCVTPSDRANLPGHLYDRIAGGKDHAVVIFLDQ
jgi:hypothetical protein